MLSPVWQRVGILTGVLLGGLCWLGILPSLQSPSGTSGLVLLNVSSSVSAVLLVIVAGIPSLMLGTLLSTMGRFTAGVCVFAGTLMVLTCFSGSVSGWITQATLPGDYWTLIIETLIWQVLVLSAVIVMYHFRPFVRQQLPQLLKHNTPWKTNIGIPAKQEIIAAIISTLVAGIMVYLLIRNATPKQVLFSLVISFALGSGIGQSLMPNTNPIAIFTSPGWVAIGSYLLVLLRFDDSASLLASLHSGSEPGTGFLSQFPGSALALPIDYMSAGILGCCIGIGVVRAASDELDVESLPHETP